MLKIRECYQRIKRGWCDSDVFSIDNWFESVIVDMLKQLKETKHGYPCDMTAEQWDKELDRMIYCFTEMQEDKCSEKNEYEEEYIQQMGFKQVDVNGKTFTAVQNYNDEELRKLWLEREKEIYNYRMEMQTKGFELFNKYFRNLWD